MICIALTLMLTTNPCLPSTSGLTAGGTGRDAAAYSAELTGSTAAKFDVVFVGDGFTSSTADVALFDGAVKRAIDVITSTAPYDRCAFNFYWVRLVSKESGADHPISSDPFYKSSVEYPVCKDTPLNMTFGDPDQGIETYYYLCSESADSCLRAAEIATDDYDYVIVLVNDPTYGGAAWATLPLLAVSLGEGFETVLPHELAHKVALLGDEYSSSWEGCYEPSELGEPDWPNVTASTDRESLKWPVDSSVPIPTDLSGLQNLFPTETTAALENKIGLWGGAAGYRCGVYRPQYTCMMREGYQPFCDVCRNAVASAMNSHCPGGLLMVMQPVDTLTPLLCIPGLTVRITLPPAAQDIWGTTAFSQGDSVVIGPLTGVEDVLVVDEWGTTVATSGPPLDDSTTAEVDPLFTVSFVAKPGDTYSLQFIIEDCRGVLTLDDYSLRVFVSRNLVVSLNAPSELD